LGFPGTILGGADMVRTKLGSVCHIGLSVFRKFARKSWQKIKMSLYFSCFIDLEIGKTISCMNPEQFTWTRLVLHGNQHHGGQSRSARSKSQIVRRNVAACGWFMT
jgi:hypothetical protein